MKRIGLLILIALISCNQKKETHHEEFLKNSPTIRENSKTKLYDIFSAERKRQIKLNGKPKILIVKTLSENERKKKELFDFDTLGRVKRHLYTEYEIINNKEVEISIIEVFVYYQQSNKLREKVKYENDIQVKRELFIYNDDLETHHYSLDGENKLIQRTQCSYDENGQLLMAEIIDKHGFVNIQQYEYHPNGRQSKFIWTGSDDETVEMVRNKDREIIYHLNVKASSTKGSHEKYDKKTISKPNDEISMKDKNQKSIYEDLGKEEIITSDSTKKIISKQRHDNIITEKVIEKLYDSFDNCIEEKIYKNGELEIVYEIEIKYYANE
jgi:hypothetical protein